MTSRSNGFSGRREFLKLGVGIGAGAMWPRPAYARPPKRGGVLKHIGVEPSSFDIHGPWPSWGAPASATYLVSSLVRRTLFRFSAGAGAGPSDFSLVPDLALKADVARDGKTYTISLRRGVRWASRPPVNGRELVAADVKYSIERALKKSPQASSLGRMESLEAIDAHTVRIHLAEPFAPLLHHLAEPWTAVLPREVEDKLGDFRAVESLIGCGPFVLERYEPGVKAVFVRNPSYYRSGLPHLDRVEWLLIRDRATQLSFFRAGQLEIPSPEGRLLRSEVAPFKRSNPSYPLVSWDGLATSALAMRTDRPPFSDVRVRRALSLALDRGAWAAQHPDGAWDEDTTAVPSAMKEWKLPARRLGEGARYLEHNPALARKLLAEARLTHGLKVKCTRWPGTDPDMAADLELFAVSLRHIGIELQMVAEDQGAGHRGGPVETAWGSFPIFTEVDGCLYGCFKTGQPHNRSRVSNPELDEMLDAQRHALSRASRKKVIDDIQRHVAAQVYYLHAPRARSVSSWAPWVKNYAPKNSLDRGAQLEVVWLDRP